MEFLDPRSRRRHRRQLMIGYLLASLAVIIGTVVLVLITYGYSYDRQTGNIIQNGLEFRV